MQGCYLHRWFLLQEGLFQGPLLPTSQQMKRTGEHPANKEVKRKPNCEKESIVSSNQTIVT